MSDLPAQSQKKTKLVDNRILRKAEPLFSDIIHLIYSTFSKMKVYNHYFVISYTHIEELFINIC